LLLGISAFIVIIMKNPFTSNEGKTMAVGMVMAVLSFGMWWIQPAFFEAWKGLVGLFTMASIASLFMPEYRAWGQGFLKGFFGLLAFIALMSFLIGIMLVFAFKRSPW
jgi:hypothetical protein